MTLFFICLSIKQIEFKKINLIEIKNKISHRGKALRLMAEELQKRMA